MAVFHLKYRPQKIADLDLEDVSSTLTNILKTGKIPQSFLFVGPKGAGKTSAARILARAVNCLKPEGVEPCGECENCKEIFKGNSMDVIEMDAASNRGIEEARDLKEKAYLLPSRLSTKVFIIDEVHMMTKDAFNALLKLIEEPPKHTIFILCTTEESKIPDTVLSRLIKISFRKGNGDELKKSLRRTIEGEKAEIDEESIELIVEKSDGSFRNLQKTFNEITLEYGNKITGEQVKAYFAARLGEYGSEEMETDLSEGRLTEILTKMEKMAEKGVDFRAYRESLLIYFQNCLLGSLGVKDKKTSKLSVNDLEKWLQLLILAGKQEKEALIDQLPLELAVVNFLKERQTEEKKTLKKIDEPIIEEKKTRETKKVDLGIDVDKITQDWGKVLTAVKPYNHSVEAFLRAAKPKSIAGNVVTLEVYYPFHKDKLEEQKNRKIVETGLSQVFGAEVMLECVLSAEDNRASLIIKNETLENVVNDQIKQTGAKSGDLYDVAKEIFG